MSNVSKDSEASKASKASKASEASEASIELVMIVKNSGEILRKTLRSAKPHIQRYTILDTGSTDNTMDIIREEFKDVPGKLHEEPFVDFSTSRNRAFDLAEQQGAGCDFFLVLDDSYELFGGERLRQILATTQADTLSLRIGELHHTVLESYYYNVRLTRCNKGWRYVGKVHECIPDPHTEFVKDDQIFINDLSDNDQVVRSRMRFRRDITLLEEDLRSDPHNPRTLMYLCKTHILVKEYETALTYFAKLQALGDTIHPEYQFFALYEEACLRFGEIDQNVELFKRQLLDLSRKFPKRGEPFYKLSTFMYELGDLLNMQKLLNKLVKFPKPELYLTTQETLIYDYYIPYLFIDVNLKLGNFEPAIALLRSMLDQYPFDQPLLNIKYAVMDQTGIQVESLAPRGQVIAIHTGRIDWCWDPRGNTKISGSEIMAINMAKEFARLGYRTFVFGTFVNDAEKIDYQCVMDGIQFIDCTYFPEFSGKYVIDYLIVSRFLCNLVYYDNIHNVYLWVHDVVPQTSRNSPLFQTHPKKFRGLITLSDWHADFVKRRLGVPSHLVIRSRNAIYADRFLGHDQIVKQPFRFLYTSDPYRGLHYLIDMIQAVHERYPQTELYIYTRTEQVTDSTRALIATLPYVHLSPRLSQEELSLELLKSDVWLYPTDFEETYCIAALEAMAAGCLVATTRLAGLISTVADRGILIDPPISDESTQSALLSKLFFVLDRPEVKERYIAKAKTWALEQTYTNLAKEWLKMFKQG
jgi:glycosyltransferase involved in cell wall biosynthesis